MCSKVCMEITKSNFSWVLSDQMTASSVKTSDTHVVTIRYHVTKPFLLADGGDRRCAWPHGQGYLPTLPFGLRTQSILLEVHQLDTAKPRIAIIAFVLYEQENHEDESQAITVLLHIVIQKPQRRISHYCPEWWCRTISEQNFEKNNRSRIKLLMHDIRK